MTNIANIANIAQNKQNQNEIIDEKFLSQELTATCIDDAKKALNRIQLVIS